MSKGCLLFAFNNETIDYVKLANSSALNIKRLLNLPTTIVTDKPITFEHVFEHVVLVDKPNHGHRHFQDYEKTVEWINFERHRAYNLSPYDETILLDADYVVSSDRLNVLFELGNSFLCHKTSFNVSGQCFDSLNNFGLYSMPMAWATVVYFKKDMISNNIFETMAMVQGNYNHYVNLYNFNHYPYRNDYALSIALNINSGHFINTDEYYIPWDLASVVPEDSIEKVNTDTYQLIYKKLMNNKIQNARVIIKDRDLHVMGKKCLEEIYEN